MADGSRVDVPRLAAEAGVTKPVTAPVFEPTRAQEAQLTRLVQSVVSEWRRELRENILPEYRRGVERRGQRPLGIAAPSADFEELERVLNAAATRTAAAAASVEPAVAAFVAEFAAWHTARFVGSIKSATRVDIGFALSPDDADDMLRAAVKRNVALIRGLDAEMAKKVENAVYDAWNQNDSAAKLRRELNARLGFAPARAKFIGRDQISKLAGELDRMRHADANLDEFEWRHSLMPNPREDHLAWHGEVFKWSSPPNGEIPGQKPNCRCRPQAVIKPKAA